MIVVKLREAMEAYRRNTGERITYEGVSKLTGIAIGTLQQIGSRVDYHPTLANVEKLCVALDVPIQEMLEIIPERPKSKRATMKKRRG